MSIKNLGNSLEKIFKKKKGKKDNSIASYLHWLMILKINTDFSLLKPVNLGKD